MFEAETRSLILYSGNIIFICSESFNLNHPQALKLM